MVNQRIERATSRRQRVLLAGAAVVLSAGFTACSGSNDGPNGPVGPDGLSYFAVTSSSVLDGATWQLNRPIDISFNRDLDFSTVSSSTIQIVDQQGVPAVGSYSQVSARVVRFQPTCPTDVDNSNGGLLQGRTYRLTVPSESTAGIGGGLTVQTTAGERLTDGVSIRFETPQSTDPLVLFVDRQAGAPSVRVRGLGVEPTDSLAASYVEFTGLDADEDGQPDREYLTFNSVAQVGEVSSEVPLNLYSRADQQFAFVLRFNQPIDGSSDNVNNQLISIEYWNEVDLAWQSVPSTVALLSNCTEIGSEVRLAPEGVVPQGAEIRAVVREGFTDLTGDALPSASTRFAHVDSIVAGDAADGITLQFDVGGDAAGSREDTVTASANPRATWNGTEAPGTLAASFDFGGTGGPGGDFDWVVSAGVDVILNSEADTILGGPDGVPINVQPIIGGVINVRDFIIEAGASVTIVGDRSCTILATREVIIRGDLSINGADNRGVGTLNTTNQPEPGAAGNGGGGNGGTGSFQTNQSTARGGTGEGAFGVPGRGGQGGETGYSLGGGCAKENRRGAGGGGGRLGEDIRYLFQGQLYPCQMLVGMDIERGIIGSLNGTGAVSQNLPAQGGNAGPSPFTDSSDENNFYGVITLADGRQIRGELPTVWAGAGGGAGGDASRTSTFPRTPFDPQGDEKGSGGGGGGGGLQILAIGDIQVLGQGSISADGGTGNGGENSIYFDRVGGGSGGGSGGHIVLSSAGRIVIESEANGPTATVVGAFYEDSLTTHNHIKRPVRALGGQGGAGRESNCGANEDGEQTWAKDSIPNENFEGNDEIPPQSATNANGVLNWARTCTLNNHATCQDEGTPGEAFGAGGDGGPGIIQLHVSDPTTQLVFGTKALAEGPSLGNGLDPTFSMAPPLLGWTEPNADYDYMVPFFSARSESFTQWIPLGLARLNADGTTDQVQFVFEGTDPNTGVVLRDGTTAQELAPLVAYTSLSENGANPSVDVATSTFTFGNGAAIDPTGLYRRNAALMREFAIRIRDGANAATEEEFIVQAGAYDDVNDEFTLVVDGTTTELTDILSGFAAPQVELVPFFFRLQSAGVYDAYPSNTEVTILFDAAKANPVTGEPSADPADILSMNDPASFTPDITDLNTDDWDFIRAKIEFMIDIDELNDPRPGLDFLKIPFLF